MEEERVRTRRNKSISKYVQHTQSNVHYSSTVNRGGGRYLK